MSKEEFMEMTVELTGKYLRMLNNDEHVPETVFIVHSFDNRLYNIAIPHMPPVEQSILMKHLLTKTKADRFFYLSKGAFLHPETVARIESGELTCMADIPLDDRVDVMSSIVQEFQQEPVIKIAKKIINSSGFEYIMEDNIETEVLKQACVFWIFDKW